MKTLELEIKKQLGFLDPLKVLDHWLKQALKIKVYKKSWPLLLSTADKSKANSRVVLLKELRQGKLIFYTNYLSQKGREIKSNPQCAFNFYWPELNKQIRGQGFLKKTGRRQSVLYWKTRSRGSQISQWLSQQSNSVSNKQLLEILRKQTERRFKNKAVPCPKHWGGYELIIQTIEFWIEGKYRLHDRFLFKKIGKKWKAERLFP